MVATRMMMDGMLGELVLASIPYPAAAVLAVSKDQPGAPVSEGQEALDEMAGLDAGSRPGICAHRSMTEFILGILIGNLLINGMR